MLNVIIIEEQKPVTELMSLLLRNMPDEIAIKSKLHSVRESITYFSEKQDADLIFSEVLLPDGLSFDIFDQTRIVLPVIFITAYDKYIMRAFETNGIDFLVKPFDTKDIKNSIAKYNSLRSHFINNRTNMPIHNLEDFINKRKKTRLLVKSGSENIPLLLENIVMLYNQDKVVYVVDRSSKKYISDKTLTELEEELDSNTFYRANRQYIVNIGFVRSFKPYERVKLLVETSIADANHPIIISQESSPKFRKWLEDA
ncbi:MAG: LytTR family DNA-binding domain-containing protein [Ginsengibacter sp.]